MTVTAADTVQSTKSCDKRDNFAESSGRLAAAGMQPNHANGRISISTDSDIAVISHVPLCCKRY